MTMHFHWYEVGAAEPLALSGLQDIGGVNGYGVLADVRGLDMPPYTIVTDDVPFQPGARLRAVKTLPRVVDLPIFVRAATPQFLDYLLRTLRVAMDPTRGDGRLRITPADGTPRDLYCRYQSGWQGDLGSAHYGVVWQDILVSLYACDPYFYATTKLYQEFRLGSTAITFLSTAPSDPFLPMQLTASTVLGQPNVNNPGDMHAWPRWTVNGPGSQIILVNVSTGQTFQIDLLFLENQQIIIDTRPGQKTVTGADGTNLFHTVNVHSTIWSLRPGINEIRVAVTQATDKTRAVMEFTPGYLGL